MDKDDAARKIVDYLRKHPDAGDTLEGITKWWLKLEKMDESVSDVADVIDCLIKKGLIRRKDVKGSKLIYKLCKKG